LFYFCRHSEPLATIRFALVALKIQRFSKASAMKEKKNETHAAPSRAHAQSQPARPGGQPPGSHAISLEDLTLGFLLRKLGKGLLKVWVALKYRFHHLTAGTFLHFKISWYKVAIAAVAFFILAKKDVQLSINMKAPFAGFGNESGPAERMGLAQAVAMKPPTKSSAALDEASTQAYIQRFEKVAQAEMQKFGIPASIKMAQGLLESQAGDHPDARRHNNHFGTLTAKRTFNNAWENWRAHSHALQQEQPELFRLGMDYEQWAHALGRTPYYYQDEQYAAKLLELIKKYQLYRLDER
jgi:flagellum-specific peptidoglycan hydrolase FlgJ